MGKKFTWDSAIKKPKKPEWLTETSQELLLKSVFEFFEEKNAFVKPYDEYYHPSQVHDMCILQEYYRRLYETDSVDEVNLYTRLLMGAGTAAHKHFQEHVLGPSKILLGDWYCALCSNVLGRMSFMPDVCSFCGAKRPNILYKEIEINDEEHKIKGKTDGILKINSDDPSYSDILLEMKTKGTNSFENVKAPTKREITQVSIYMHFLKLSECMFVYINRDTYDFKMVPAKKDNHAVQVVFDKISLIKESLEEGKPPYKDKKPCRKCRKSDSGNAKKCPFNEECWSLKDE